MHHGGHDGSADAIGPSFNEGDVGGSGTRRIVPEDADAAYRSEMAPWTIKRGRGRDGNGKGGIHKGGGERGQGSGDSLVGGVVVALTRMRMMVAADGANDN